MTIRAGSTNRRTSELVQPLLQPVVTTVWRPRTKSRSCVQEIGQNYLACRMKSALGFSKAITYLSALDAISVLY